MVLPRNKIKLFINNGFLTSLLRKAAKRQININIKFKVGVRKQDKEIKYIKKGNVSPKMNASMIASILTEILTIENQNPSLIKSFIHYF